MPELRQEPSARARDAGVTRLKHATRGVLLAATALAGAFAGLAAHSFAGHKARAAVVRTRTVRRVITETQAQRSAQQTTAQAPQVTTTAAPPPAVTTVAPVAVSGAT